MTYVVSDIHGQYNLFMKMLKEINFTDNDEMWVLGDVVDRGKESIKTLIHIIQSNNIHMLLGNHEEFMLDFFSRNKMPRNMSEVYEMSSYEMWFRNGGIETIRELKNKYTTQMRNKVLQYIRNLSVAEIVIANKNKFYIAHADLQIHDGIISQEQNRDYTIWNRKIPSERDKLKYNMYLITGHMHQAESKIFKHENWICIGSETKGYGILSCLRLDDFKEFYVSE